MTDPESQDHELLDPRLAPALSRLEQAARRLDDARYPGTAWRAPRRFTWAAGLAAAAAAAVIVAALAWPRPAASPARPAPTVGPIAMTAPGHVASAASGGLAVAPPLPMNLDSCMLSMPEEVGMISSGLAGPWVDAAVGNGPGGGNGRRP